MKIIITENKVERLKELIKTNGVKQVIDLMGGFDTFCKVLNIDTFMEFLHLFDDLEVVQSETDGDWTLFRYKKGYNLMVYNRRNDEVYISSDIWWVLDEYFDLTNLVIQKVTEKWLGEVYNLRGIKTVKSNFANLFSWMRTKI
jgi:hypothetical protein